MKITDFFSSSKSFTNSGEGRLVCTPAANNTEQQEESMSVTGSITVQTPRKRRERFSDPEVHKLVDTILVHIQQLFGPKPLNVSGKAAVWDKVVKEVNKVGGMRRTHVECKKRWMDYKRKIKQTIDSLKMHSSLGGQMRPLSEMFSKRQIMVAQLFKMDASDGPKNETHDESSSEIGECVSSNEHVLTPSYFIDSEDEFFPSQNKSLTPSACLPSTSQQDKFISQSYEEPQPTTEPRDSPITKTVDSSKENIAAESRLQLGTQMDQLIAQQKNIFEMLQSMQKTIATSLNIQNKMYNLVKGSTLELQKTVLSSQKASSDHNSILELRLNSLHAKLDEMNSVLQVKQLQELMSSDESELSASGTQDIRSTPTATYTPAATYTQARKRAVDQDPTLIDSMKKAKKI
ncbi:uncharacterized protein LOC142661977 isoform X1 [Rhinoderma darwinii]|uniref:uncharacterized protein LOC142661977 isoform X1 n=1 Tax=Rhinoderma darwinii TaxID=43563 RepID=UPI003F6695CB